MESQNNKSSHTLAALAHISTFSKYIIPLGNFIFPLIIWSTGKKEPIIDHHGKQALNFQLSIFFYMVLVVFCAVAGIVIIGLNSGMEQFSIPGPLENDQHTGCLSFSDYRNDSFHPASWFIYSGSNMCDSGYHKRQ